MARDCEEATRPALLAAAESLVYGELITAAGAAAVDGDASPFGEAVHTADPLERALLAEAHWTHARALGLARRIAAQGLEAGPELHAQASRAGEALAALAQALTTYRTERARTRGE
ncbi:MAG: hypothetical protein HS116_17660 [Planctomycetes bacterium]|nr:hypothetical protein [Planctomycetota bacterium]